MKTFIASLSLFALSAGITLSHAQGKYTLLKKDGLKITYTATKQGETTDMAGNPMVIYKVRFTAENASPNRLGYEVLLKLQKYNLERDADNWPLKTLKLNGVLEPGGNNFQEYVQHIYKNCTECLGSTRLEQVTIGPADAQAVAASPN